MAPDRQRLSYEQYLHSVAAPDIEKAILELAMSETQARHGAIFVRTDDDADTIELAIHVVDTLEVPPPEGPLEKAGIAQRVLETGEMYYCADTETDPHYTRYLLDVGSIAAAPIKYQGRTIGVISLSARKQDAFADNAKQTLRLVAASASTFLRRAQLDRKSRERTGQPFLIKGLSPEWRLVENKIERAAPTVAPILIRGESGTGKDLVAKAVHYNSKRATKPLVTVNCAAIPENMLESLLFGHVKGAFTDATYDKVGEFQKADGGTLFLDEVGELPVMLQAKVLRAVEQGEVQPLGSNEAAKTVDVRLICATNRDLEAMAREGLFREDLYFRLGVLTIDLPPLRTFKDNLEVLAHVFLSQAAQKHGKSITSVTPRAMEMIKAYHYPGNIRELKNAIEHAVIMARDHVRAKDLPEAFGGDDDAAQSSSSLRKPLLPLAEMRQRWLAPLERQYLAEVLSINDGNVREAAAMAGINHVTMYRLLKRHGLKIQRSVKLK